MIKTFEQYIYQIYEENGVIFQILDNKILENCDLINEEYRFEYYHRENKPSLNIPFDISKRLTEIEKRLEGHLDKINPFEGKTDKNSLKFKIKATEHWYEKFFRKEMEPYLNLKENPKILEGIDLIYNNKNLITRYISNGTFNSRMKILIKTKDDSLYSEIIKLDIESKNVYKIYLITQIKGVLFNFKTEKTVLFHPQSLDMI